MARFCLLWLIPFVLHAGPALRVLEVDSSHFPNVEILAELGEGEGTPQFTLRDGAPITPSITASRKEADRLVLAVVFDATGSIPAADYRRAQNGAGVFLSSLTESDRTALFQINGGSINISGFVPGGKTISEQIAQMKRVGRTTRIFDALHSGINAAREGILRNQNTESSSKQIAKAAVLLFTDGRDEASYLNEQDCLELAELGTKLRVPVYTVLYGHPRNQRVFQRLSMRTGGKLITMLTPDTMRNLSRSIRLLKDETFRLSYKAPEGAGPRNIVLSVKRGTTIDEDTASYNAPSVSIPHSEGPWYNSIPWGNALLGVLSFLLFVAAVVALILVLKQKHDAAKATNPAVVSASDSPTAHVKLPEGETEKVDIVEGIPAEDMPHPAVQYLRENAYRSLQEALRGAPRYAAASLIRMKDGMSREYDLFLENTALGSGRWASIRVEDSGAAKVHAKVKRVDSRYVLYDLMGGSSVFLNGKKLLRPRGLHDGDEIKLGRSVFQFRGKGKGNAAAPDDRTETVQGKSNPASSMDSTQAMISDGSEDPADYSDTMPEEDLHDSDFLQKAE
ncbi:MAG: FHA domain-containing protein [Leptospirales bacterium]|nr:FHA domain-containing protein [Leptospirales bacterium]